jgi:DNA-directed RNA polymerase alpha subunit
MRTKSNLRKLKLSNRAYNCLRRNGYDRIEQVQGLGYDKLMSLHNCGRVSALEILEKLEAVK